MERVRYVIIGAGISGLSFANWVASDDYLVLEREAEIGGFCRTIKQDGFVWDYSGHFFHFKRKEIEEYLLARMEGQNVRVVEKDARIHHEGVLIDFPFQKNIHQLPKQAFIDCLYDLYFKEDAAPENFEHMLRVKFGDAIAEKFLIPYNEKLYATDLSELDVEAMGRFFPYADTRAIIGNFKDADNLSYNATFTYPEGGAIQYVNALASEVDSAKIRLNQEVVGIDLKSKVVTTAAGDQFAYDYLITAMPFVKLLELTELDFDPATYTWNKVLCFNLGFDRKGPEGVHWIYFADKGISFYRIGFYDNIFGTDRMSMYVELGFPHDTEVTGAMVETLRARVLEDLKAVGVVDDHALVSHHHVVLNPAYVHITKASVADVSVKKQTLGLAGVHSIGRYGSWTYCSIEDNIVEARTLARAFNALE